MKIKKSLLEQIIREEIEAALLEESVELIEEGFLSDLKRKVKGAILPIVAAAGVSLAPSIASAGTATVGYFDEETRELKKFEVEVPDQLIDGGETQKKIEKTILNTIEKTTGISADRVTFKKTDEKSPSSQTAKDKISGPEYKDSSAPKISLDSNTGVVKVTVSRQIKGNLDLTRDTAMMDARAAVKQKYPGYKEKDGATKGSVDKGMFTVTMQFTK